MRPLSENRTTRRVFAAAAGIGLASAIARGADSDSEPGVRPLAGSEVEKFPAGSTGQKSEFRGAEGSYIACYLRRPKGPGLFPVVVILHGNAANVEATYTFGRDRPP